MNLKSHNKKILWVDMDGVLVDLGHSIDNHPLMKTEPERWKGRVDELPGVYRNPPPIEGAIEAIQKLHESGKYDMYVATTNCWNNPEGATDKRYWIENIFGEIFYKRQTITHKKNLLIGDYLIDDRTKNGAAEFSGEHLHFGSDEYPDWDSILKYLL